MDYISKNNRHGLKRRNGGFSLMEIMIAMAILAIVSGVLIGNFFTSLVKGRDSGRKQALKQISNALELYYNDHKSYPTGTALPWGSSFTDGSTIYMQTLPADPKASSNFSYTYNYVANPPAGGGSGYRLYACLENTNDPSYVLYPTPGLTCGSGCANSNNYCSYGISSANTSP